jgi:hypothetical protein
MEDGTRDIVLLVGDRLREAGGSEQYQMTHIHASSHSRRLQLRVPLDTVHSHHVLLPKLLAVRCRLA